MTTSAEMRIKYLLKRNVASSLLMSTLLALTLSGCAARQTMRFLLGGVGYSVSVEEPIDVEAVSRGFQSDASDFNLPTIPSSRVFGIERLRDFEPMPFLPGNRFELQTEMYVWDSSYLGAKRTLGRTYFSLSTSMGPYVARITRDGKKEETTYWPIKRIERGHVLRYKEHKGFADAFLDVVPILVDEENGEEYILETRYKFMWLKPKLSASPLDIAKLPIIEKNSVK